MITSREIASNSGNWKCDIFSSWSDSIRVAGGSASALKN